MLNSVTPDQDLPVFRTQLPSIISCAVTHHLTPLYLDFLVNETWKVVVTPSGYFPAMCEYGLQGPCVWVYSAAASMT